MSKVGQAFGGGGGKKPSTAEIFFTLAALQKEKDRLAKLGVTGVGVGGADGGAGGGAGNGAGDASLKKFEKGRRTKAGRLKGGRVGGPSSEEETDNTIKRPGARSAKLLGQ